MKKCQGLLNHLLYSKKKSIHPSRSLENSTNNKIATIINYNSKVSKSKPKISLNKTQDIKLHTAGENKKWLLPQNCGNQMKIRSQNHSFTTAVPSEKLFLEVSNQKQSQSNMGQINHDARPLQISQVQLGNNYSNITYYNKMRQKMAASSMMQNDKAVSSNASFYQYRKGLLSNLKLQKEKKSAYLNKSMSSYEEEWCDKDTHPNASSSAMSLLSRLKAIEGQLEEGLSELEKRNEGKLITTAKSYNLYKIAIEEVLKELPQEYYQILKKIVNGYHQIIITFVSEQKKIIENYDDLQTKYTSINKELFAIKSSGHIENNCEFSSVKPVQPQGQATKEEFSNGSLKLTGTAGNAYLFNLLNSGNAKLEHKKQESHPNDKESKGYINSTQGDKARKSLGNKSEMEVLDALYFSDKVQNGTNSSIGVTLNVPKLSLNFLV